MSAASAVRTATRGQQTGGRRNRRQGTRHGHPHDSKGPRTRPRVVHQNAPARPTTGYAPQPIRAAKPGQTKRRGFKLHQAIDGLVQSIMGEGIKQFPEENIGRAAHTREMLEDYTDEDLRVVAKDLGVKRTSVMKRATLVDRIIETGK